MDISSSSFLNCNLEKWAGLENRIDVKGADLASALSLERQYRKQAAFYAAKHDADHVLYSVKQYDWETERITTVSYFVSTSITDEELGTLIDAFPDAEFGVIHTANSKRYCQELLAEEKSKRIRPITLKAANAFVEANHRHHDSVTGCKFAIGLYKTVKGEDKLIGTAICGRPVSRFLDDGVTLEINRLCVTEPGNCCSMLYSAATRIAKEMGYEKVITYILESEDGTSLRASGFKLESECCGGKKWTGKRKNTSSKLPPEEYKQRWIKKVG